MMIEKKLVLILSVLLIILNLISLYFIIVLLSYDEIIGYLQGGKRKSDNPRFLAHLFFVTGILNLLFISVLLMSRLLSDKRNN